MAAETEPRQIVRVEPSEPSAPRFRDLTREITTVQKPLPKELEELQAGLDKFAGTLANSPEPVPVLDFKFSAAVDLLLRQALDLRWPRGLYVPGAADWRQYWLTPPTAGSNRYTRQWISGNGSGANQANAATGDLFAYAAARPTDPFLRSEAAVGFLFTPTAKLAVYEIEVTVNLIGQDRYDVSTTAPAGGALREWGGLYTAAWEVSPVDGSLSLVRPFGVVTLFNERFENLTGIPIHNFPLKNLVKSNIMLEGSRTYLIGVIAAVQIDNGWTMNDGRPMQPLPEGSLWKAWCSITGNIPQVWIAPAIVYIA